MFDICPPSNRTAISKCIGCEFQRDVEKGENEVEMSSVLIQKVGQINAAVLVYSYVLCFRIPNINAIVINIILEKGCFHGKC